MQKVKQITWTIELTLDIYMDGSSWTCFCREKIAFCASSAFWHFFNILSIEEFTGNLDVTVLNKTVQRY